MQLKAENIDPFQKPVRIICMHHLWHIVTIENAWFWKHWWIYIKGNIKLNI